ncbi:sensor histidine kinase [Aureisphaera galaxeae]|uniref:sensor histidine kinase n=1 Tax=Aureisphaera galaxeae TaxID=1538023 RepID=UPI002350413E|nr:sensor histidine kinase [Aureisphaera galaxeae]MDC8004755.1 sensor histidine kinase [Aureisphaera galaxeae]
MEDLLTSDNQVINIILIAIGLLLLMAIAIVLFFYFSRKKIIKAELEKARLEIDHQKELLQATIITQEEERSRIAQDLHDAISSKLNVVSLNANFLTEKDITTDDANKFGESILNVTSTVLENSRRIAHDLLPPTLSKFGLEAALEELCDEVSESGKFEVRYEANYPMETLPSDEELHLFRVIQELMNNSIKYSEASQIDVALHKEDSVVRLAYMDNGKGFDINDAMNSKGLGMSGIKNRAAILKAELSMTSAPNEGIEVKIEKPLGSSA